MSTKISQLPSDSSPTTTDYVPTVDAETSTTKKSTLANLITLFFNNIPAATLTNFFDHVESGLVWSGDAYASTRNASMTSGVVWMNGVKRSISAVSARTFTASKDTYVDIDTSGALVYTEVANNAASPALTAGYLRIAIIVTGASNIASAGSVNQGQGDKVLPIASSVAYTTTDSLGNRICPRDPQRRLLGYRQITSNVTTTSTSVTQLTGLSVPVVIPTDRRVIISTGGNSLSHSAGGTITAEIWDGTVGSGTRIASTQMNVASATGSLPLVVSGVTTPASSSKTYNVGFFINTGTATALATSTSALWVKVELV